MKRFTSSVFAALGLVCVITSVAGLTGCSKKEEPVPHADPNNNSDDGKSTMSNKGSDKSSGSGTAEMPGSGPDKK